jgi:hypothetical protein
VREHSRFGHSLEIARRQEAKTFELRAATRDLQAAKALLGELG